jgi:phosphatidylserine synthase
MPALYAALWVIAAMWLFVDLAIPSHRPFWRRFLASVMLLATGGLMSYAIDNPTVGNLAISLELAGAISMVISFAIMIGSGLVAGVRRLMQRT